MNFDKAIESALRNIASFGDTDIFPFPLETHVFFDRLDDCRGLLQKLHENFNDFISSYPPATIVSLTQVGYTGFRWATQIEPFWNAYYLALLISIADQIELERIAVQEKVVFSYRYEWDDKTAKLFMDITWKDYRIHSLELSKNNQYVVTTDIADFYPRINHHRIENSLNRLPSPSDIPRRIMQLLSSFSKNVSYGLPIGGPASRILAELALVPKVLSLCR
jgi:hypothetical protein